MVHFVIFKSVCSHDGNEKQKIGASKMLEHEVFATTKKKMAPTKKPENATILHKTDIHSSNIAKLVFNCLFVVFVF